MIDNLSARITEGLEEEDRVSAQNKLVGLQKEAIEFLKTKVELAGLIGVKGGEYKLPENQPNHMNLPIPEDMISREEIDSINDEINRKTAELVNLQERLKQEKPDKVQDYIKKYVEPIKRNAQEQLIKKSKNKDDIFANHRKTNALYDGAIDFLKKILSQSGDDVAKPDKNKGRLAGLRKAISR